MDRIPIATKGGKTATGKDQIIHYTQQQGEKLFFIQRPRMYHDTLAMNGNRITADSASAEYCSIFLFPSVRVS